MRSWEALALYATLILYVLAVLGDSLSTYLLLSVAHPGHLVWEANPLAAWTFEQLGLLPGLLLGSGFKLLSVAILCLFWHHNKISFPTRILLNAVLAGATILAIAANINNWYIWSIVSS